MLLHGIFPPITTPFYPDGRVYFKKLEHNVERYSKTPIGGITVLGSTGEAIMLSDDERRDILKTARESCSPHKVSIAGTSHIKRSATVTATFDAVTPRMLKAAQAELQRENAELISVGVLSGAGKIHAGTGAPARNAEGHLGTATLRGSAEPDSALNQTLNGLKTRQKEVGFQILAGTAQRLFPGLNAGAVGAVLAFAAPAPTACYEIYAAWQEGDADLARLKQERISATAVRVASELGIPAMKYALDLNGYYGGPPRLPLLPLTADLQAGVEKLMSDIRN